MRWALAAMLVPTLAASEGVGGSGMLWISPEIRPYVVQGSASLDWEAPADPDGPATSYARRLWRVNARAQAWHDERHELVLSTGWTSSRTDTDARFASVGEYPQRLSDLRVGIAGRRVWSAGQVLAASVSVGSADRRAFDSSEGTSTTAAITGRLPLERDAWLLMLFYSDNSSILAGVPIPGAMYEWNPRPEVKALIGLPISFATWRFGTRASVDVAASLFGTARVGVNGSPLASAPWLRATAAFDWGDETYAWPERLGDERRVHLRHLRANAGLGASLGPATSLTATIGWAFDRDARIGRSYFRTDDEIELPATWTAGLSLRAGF